MAYKIVLFSNKKQSFEFECNYIRHLRILIVVIIILIIYFAQLFFYLVPAQNFTYTGNYVVQNKMLCERSDSHVTEPLTIWNISKQCTSFKSN